MSLLSPTRALSLLLAAAFGGAVPLSIAASTATAGDNPRELGVVRWTRSYDEGVRRARASGRPVFLLFQEVPGCATCEGFGESVLSHPLLVDAIETEFVPVAIFNNRGGADRAVLERFGEPAWNNPVVRFVDAEGRDLVPRADGVWSPGGISDRMIRALERAGRPVPGYLEVAAAETRVRRSERATFETHCFWEGEGCLGALPGVVATRAAWQGGREVVEVRFDPDAVSRADLLRAAREARCAEAVYVEDARSRDEARAAWGDRVRESRDPPRPAPASDQKRYLRGTPLAALDLSPLQAARVNAALGNGGDPLRWLSPRQRAALAATD